MSSKHRTWKEVDELIREHLGLGFPLIGVKFMRDNAREVQALKPGRPMEYCKMLRTASTENKIYLYDRSDEACMTAHFVLGFRELKLSDTDLCVVPPGTKSILVAPLSRMEEDPDVIHAILTPRQMMDLTIILRRTGIGRLSTEFGGEKACSDFTAKPYLNRKPAVSFLCRGARLFAEFRENELIFGAPPEVYLQSADVIAELMKGGGPLCGCKISDIPTEIVEEFDRMGLSKGIDYFFGKIDGTKVRVYLNKDLNGRFRLLTVHIPIKMNSEEDAKKTVEKLMHVVTKPYKITQRGAWVDLTMTATPDELAVDLHSGENVEKTIKSIVGYMKRYLQRIS